MKNNSRISVGLVILACIAIVGCGKNDDGARPSLKRRNSSPKATQGTTGPAVEARGSLR